ncbi:hypothetical protein CCR75_003348 [Bremia lactucae]|uniref:Reverse transcriptase domain-containing protein n=1 Tax=Bremia lactucae TaxID=4779 RepID=A0A976FIR4_BRELC|nr:hypothetical protein CCR75_003348 [Bremia lactucae]
MFKLAMVMVSQLATATQKADLDAAMSRAILLLGFRKAYDTVDRECLYEALRQLRFAERYVQLIAQLHTGTTATFLVNEERSKPIPVVSGIRQGCLLAPLLILLVVELLGIAVQQTSNFTGLPVPVSRSARTRSPPSLMTQRSF